MGTLDSIHDAGVVGRGSTGLDPGADTAAGGERNVYLTKESLTFPGVATVGGMLAAIIGNVTGATEPNWIVSVAIGVVLGGFLLALGLVKASSEAKAEPGFILESAGVAVLNTIMLVAAIHGISEVTSPG